MRFTSEDLLKAMGLKVNDVVQLDNGEIFKVVLNPMHINHDGKTYTNDIYELEFKDSKVRMSIMILLNNSYTIIQPKPILTEDEKVILRNTPCIEISREMNDDGFGGERENLRLIKGEIRFDFNLFRSLFKSIKIGEKYSIKELLEE